MIFQTKRPKTRAEQQAQHLAAINEAVSGASDIVDRRVLADHLADLSTALNISYATTAPIL